MSKARTLADMISDGVIGTTELADDVITPVKLDETGSYVVSGLTANGGSGAVTLAANSDIRATSGNWTGEHSGKIQYHNNQWYLQFADDLIARNGSAVNVFKVDSTGSGYFASNVAIGITSASKKLSVHASTSYDGALISNAHSSSAARLQLTNDDSKSLQVDMGGSTQPTYGPFGANIAAVVSASAPLNIGTDSANHVAFYTNLIERMFISSSGSVGINNNSPTESLHIKGTNPRIYVEGDSNSYYPSIRVDGVNGGISLGTYFGGNISGTNGITFLTGSSDTDSGTERMRITSSGSVGIGRAPTSTYKLDLHGELSGNWLAHIHNSHTTNGYGVKIRAGDDNNVSAFRVSSQDNATTILECLGGGVVQTPNQPTFHATRTNHVTSTGVIVFDSVNLNVGSHYSSTNGRFTAPIAGSYIFAFSALLYSMGNASLATLYVNGSVKYNMSSLGTYGSFSGSYAGQGGTVIVGLNAGDYATVHFTYAGTKLHSNYTYWSGMLLG